VDVVNRAADARPGFWLQNVQGFDGSFLRLPRGEPAFNLRNVSDFRLLACRAQADRDIDQVDALTF